MSTYVVVGLQYGDEGKGKITDVLSAKSDYVVRFQGGDNAGHTVYVGDEKFVLHLLPSGVLQCRGKCIIANGVVVNPLSFLNEIEQLESRGISTDHIFISKRAHVIMPYHILLDRYREEEKGGTEIGTTKKGIGPCYEDKIARVGIRMVDLLNPEILREKIEKNLRVKNSVFEKYFERDTLDTEEIYTQFVKIGEKLKHRIVDTEVELNEAIRSGKNVLFEGAQALMLDIDFGTYPFVTSSSPSTGEFAREPEFRRLPYRILSAFLKPIPPGWAMAHSPPNCTMNWARKSVRQATSSGLLPGGRAEPAGWIWWR